MVRIMPDQSGSPSCRWIIFEPTAYRNATQLMSARLALAAAPSAPQLNGQEKYFKSLSITAATSGITLIASVGRGAVEKIQERQCPERGGGSLLLKGNVLLQEHSENIGLGQRGGGTWCSAIWRSPNSAKNRESGGSARPAVLFPQGPVVGGKSRLSKSAFSRPHAPQPDRSASRPPLPIEEMANLKNRRIRSRIRAEAAHRFGIVSRTKFSGTAVMMLAPAQRAGGTARACPRFRAHR
jgi:hypothetical protein